MSQKTQLRRVRVHGSIYLGDETLPDGSVVPMFSGDPDRVMNWLSDGFRVRFNQHRSKRSRYLTSVDRDGNVGKVASPDGEPILVPIGATVIDLTDRQARQRHSFLAAVPAMVLQSPERIENTDWFSATKRRKTNASKGAKSGSMPGFRSRKHSDQRFVCWFNSGSNAVFQKTGKRSGVVVITGKNPPGLVAPDGTIRWRVVLHVRLSQDIRPYTSVRVNWTRREVVFVNAPLPVSRREMSGAAVGLDRGVAHAVADSDGRFYDMPGTSDLDKRRKWHQKRMAKSRVTATKQARPFWESRHYQERKSAAAMLSAKIARINRERAHNISTQIVREYDFVGTEALKLTNMTRKAHGKGAAGRRGRNRATRDSRLGLINSLIEYKCVVSGVPFVRVNPAYTSQRCNKCGHTAKENRESQAVFLCQECGHTDHADTNAAKNILDDALIKAAVEAAVRTLTDAGSKDETEARKDLDPGLAALAMNRRPPNVMSHGGLGIPVL